MPEKRKSAFNRALQEAQQQSETVIPPQGNTVSQQQSETVTPSQSITLSQQQGETAIPSHSSTVLQQQGETVTQPHSSTVIRRNGGMGKKEEKVTFYLTTEQVNKLDDLVYEYKQRTGKRINRNDIVRYLINECVIDNLNSLV